MQKRYQPIFILSTSLLLAAMLCYSPLINAAESTASGDAPISQDTADAILKELREIRQVLEKIERQGARGSKKPSRPTTAKVSTKGETRRLQSPAQV